MSVSTQQSRIHVGSRAALREQDCIVVRGADRPIAVFYNGGDVRAVDNRCPHMGFPLHRGSCADGIITCHWHHARFDAHSGCTFDLFADDVEAYDVTLEGEQVYVAALPRARDVLEHGRRRLHEGMQQNIPLIAAKAVLALRGAGLPADEIVREAALFGLAHRDDWSMGLTVLTALANVQATLDEETGFLALYQGVRRVAADCAGRAPRVPLRPLETPDIPLETLQRWLNQWTIGRHRDGAERTLLTAVASGASLRELARLVFTAAMQRAYADAGHLVDFCNKAFELLERIGPEHAERVLPAIANQLVSARGGEESNAWRHPIDLVPLLDAARGQLAARFARGKGKTWQAEPALAEAMLGEEPAAILEAIGRAIEAGATPPQLGQALVDAAAWRVARFGTANEMGDWITALHTFSYCHALHQALQRCPEPALVPGVLHGAMAIYLDRFLNVPPARLPGERGGLDDLPTDAATLLTAFRDALDQQQQVDRAARLVARYLDQGHAAGPLLNALVHAAVREDADFHTIQMVEAAIRQWQQADDNPASRRMLLAAARYLAAHSPTPRTQWQTARIALRLHRGENVYEEDSAS